MVEKLKNYFTRIRICSIITLITMIMNIFSPYVTYGATTPKEGEPYFVLKLHQINEVTDDEDMDTDQANYYYDWWYKSEGDQYSDSKTHFVTVDLIVKQADGKYVNGAAINLKYDNTMMKPAYHYFTGGRKGEEVIEYASTIDDFAEINWESTTIHTFNDASNSIRIDGASSKPLNENDIIATFTFLLEEGITIEDLTPESLTLLKGEKGVTDGLTITYFPSGFGTTQALAKGEDYLFYDGFATDSTPQITDVNLTGALDNKYYYVGQKLDYSGLKLSIEYDNNPDDLKEYTLQDAIDEGIAVVEPEFADDKETITIKVGKEELTCQYYVASSINVSTPPSDLEYEHDDPLSFAGGKVTIGYRDGHQDIKDIEDLIRNNLLTADKEKANFNDPNVTFTYIDKKLSAVQPLQVTDPVVKIEIEKLPKVEYEHDESIDVNGGSIKATTKSGVVTTGIAMNSDDVDFSPKTADINQCDPKWVVPGSQMSAGTQKITVTYNKIETSYNVTVNDKISSISVKQQPNVKNKYDTPADNLDFTGAIIEVQTASGHTFEEPVTNAMVDKAGYNPQSLTEQNLPVEYGKCTTDGDGVKFTLRNYIKSIKVTTPNDYSSNYGEELDLNGVTYKKIYANGDESESFNVENDMLDGYVKNPAGSLFDASHEYVENVTVKLNADDVTADELEDLPLTDTFSVTVKDKITGIQVDVQPTVSFDYGDPFNANGGSVKLSYASGAPAGNSVSMSDSHITITELNDDEVDMEPDGDSFTNGKMSKNVKIKYTDDNGESFTTTMGITIYDILNSISIQTNPKTTFKHGDPFSAEDGVIDIIYESGKKEQWDLDDPRLSIVETDTQSEVNMSPTKSDYAGDYKVTKNLTVSYEYRDVTQKTNYDIDIKDYVEALVINPSSITGTLNTSLEDLLSDNKVKYKLRYKVNGETEEQDVTKAMIKEPSGFNPASDQNQTVTVKIQDSQQNSYTYLDEKEAELNIKLSNTVTRVTIDPPSKTTYKHGEPLDLEHAVVTLHYADGSSGKGNPLLIEAKEGVLDVEMSPTSYPANNKVSKTIQLEYTDKDSGQKGTASYEIEIINDVRSIEMNPADDPITEYNVNDKIDLSEGSILVQRAVGTKESIDLNDSQGRVKVTNFNSDTAKEGLELTVTFTENGIAQTTTYEVDIVDKIKSIQAIVTESPLKVKYGENIDFSNVKVTATMGSGPKDLDPTEKAKIAVSDFINTKIDSSQIVKLTYEGVTCTLEVQVLDYVDKIELSTNSLTGVVNTELGDLIQNLKYTVKYKSGKDVGPTPVTQSMLNDNVPAYDKTKASEQKLKVKYLDGDENSFTQGTTFEAELKIKLEDTAQKITITPPTDVEFKYGDELTFKGGSITIEYAGGSTDTKDIDSSMVTEQTTGLEVDMEPEEGDFGADHTLTKKLVIKYQEDEVVETKEYDIKIINDVRSIEMNPADNPKTEYNLNEGIDLSEGSILVQRAVGAKESIDLNDAKGRVAVTGFKSDVENDNLELTVTFTENGIPQTTTYEVDIVDKIKSIQALATESPLKVKYGENIDFSNVKVTATMGSGPKDLDPTEKAKIAVSDFINTKIDSSQIVKLTYEGVTCTLEVQVLDYVDKIELSTNSLTGVVNTELGDLIQNLKYTVKYKSGKDVGPTPVTQSMLNDNVPAYDKTKASEQKLKVKYLDGDENSFTQGTTFEAELKIKLEDTAQKITITPPTDVEFKYGDELTFKGGSITIEYAGGSTDTKDIDSSMVTEQTTGLEVDMEPEEGDFGADHTLTKKLVIKYQEDEVVETKEYDIKIINDVRSIEMNPADNPKTEYNLNEGIDLSEGSILVQRAVGAKESIDLNDAKGRVAVTGFKSDVENDNLELTVTFTENGIPQTTTYEVDIVDKIKSIQALATESPLKVKYGENIDFSNVKVTATMGSGPKDLDPTEKAKIAVSDFINTKIDSSQIVKLTYEGVTCTLEVQVLDYVDKIELSKNSLTGAVNTELEDLIQDLKYTVKYKSGKDVGPTPVDQSMLNDNVPAYDKTKASEQKLKVKYLDEDGNSFTQGTTFEAELTVKLEDTAQKITITPPTDVEFKYGDELTFKGGSITIEYAGGSTDTKDIDSSMVTEQTTGLEVDMEPEEGDFGADHTLTKKLVIKYQEDEVVETKEYDIKIINDVRSIEMNPADNPKTEYNLNEGIDLSEGSILVQRAVGAKESIDLNDAKGRVAVTGFKSDVENDNLELTVTFTENGIAQTTTYNVKIKNKITGLVVEVKDPPVKSKYGEDLDLKDYTIKITDGNGERELTEEEKQDLKIEDFNKYDTSGPQDVKVKYGDVSCELNVEVQDYVDKIEISQDSISDSYNKSLQDLIDENNLQYTVIYASGEREGPKPVEPEMIEDYDPQTVQEQNLKVKYEDNNPDSFTKGHTFETDLTVTLVDHVKDLKATGLPTESRYGEDLDFSETVITVTRDSGDEEIDISEVEVNGYDKERVGQQDVTLEYGGQTFEFTVEVKDYVKDIILVEPIKKEYSWSNSGDLDLTGGSVQKVMASGDNPEAVSLEDGKGNGSVQLSNFIPNQEGKQTITVTYEGFTKSFEVEVIDHILSIQVKNAPSSVDYGHDIDLKDVTLEVVKESGTSTIPVTPDMLSEYDSTYLEGPQTITVTYGEETDTFNITVNDYLVDIVLTPPSKTTYQYGESLELSDAYITKVTASGKNTETVQLTELMVKGYDSHRLGPQTLNVEYEGITKSFGVVVVDDVKSITMNTTPKKDYLYGESLDVDGGTINVTRSSGTTTQAITPDMVTNFDPNKVGPQTLTVTYENQTTTYEVNVQDYIKEITIDYPDKLVYKLNEPMDLSGGKVNVVMASGTIKETVDMREDMIEGFDTRTTGAKIITVKYEGKTATFGITVVDELTEMSIFQLPNKLEYLFGEAMDLAGGSIQIKRESGNQEIIPMDASMITGFTTNRLGQVLLTVNYEGLTDTFYINVSDYESDAILTPPNKLTYEYGEELDLTGGSIKIKMASGAIKEEARLTASMISGFNSKVVGTQTLTVNYKGYTKTFNITVTDSISGIALNTPPNKTEYKYGENLDVTGGTIKVIKTSGTDIVNITQDMVSGYNPNVSGYQVVKVNYQGFTTDFVVYVYPKVAPSTNDNNNSNPSGNNPSDNNPGNNNSGNNNSNGISSKRKPKRTSMSSVNNNNQSQDELKDNTTEDLKDKEDNSSDTDTNTNVNEKTEYDNKNRPTITLGEKDVAEDNKDNDSLSKKKAVGVILGASILLLILLLTKKNTEIYVEENGEFVLAGKERLSRNKTEINVNDYLDGETYNSEVKIILNDRISEKLDGETITIKHRDRTLKIKLIYNDEPIIIKLNSNLEEDDDLKENNKVQE